MHIFAERDGRSSLCLDPVLHEASRVVTVGRAILYHGVFYSAVFYLFVWMCLCLVYLVPPVRLGLSALGEIYEEERGEAGLSIYALLLVTMLAGVYLVPPPDLI